MRFVIERFTLAGPRTMIARNRRDLRKLLRLMRTPGVTVTVHTLQ